METPRSLSPRFPGFGTLVKRLQSLTYFFLPSPLLTLHIALVGPHCSEKREKRAPVKGAWLPLCCLCIFVRRLNLHVADRDMSSLDERVTETVSDRQPFFSSATAGSTVARVNR